MRRVLMASIILLLAVPADAQRMGGKERKSKDNQSQTEQQEKKRAADKADKDYRNALKSIPDKAAPTDPWKNVR